MLASDITADDIGAVLVIPLEDVNVVGRLMSVSWPAGMVRLELGDDGKKTPFTIAGGKLVTVTRDHARFRALTEPDRELRGRWLLELNHLGVLRLLGDVLGDAS